MTDIDTITSDSALPAEAAAKLTELKHRACAAMDHWNNGNRRGALDALTAAIPAAAAAATAVNIMLELERAAAHARAQGHRPYDDVTDRSG
ncbi:hypothetical protein [Kitasatospora cinereorecta]|uniref:HNH endonuclease n=1 Tax=Kitasatospora cinereorecta TaxID=285560 RepID=A0ABW0VH91_9ACTN